MQRAETGKCGINSKCLITEKDYRNDLKKVSEENT